MLGYTGFLGRWYSGTRKETIVSLQWATTVTISLTVLRIRPLMYQSCTIQAIKDPFASDLKPKLSIEGLGLQPNPLLDPKSQALSAKSWIWVYFLYPEPRVLSPKPENIDSTPRKQTNAKEPTVISCSRL